MPSLLLALLLSALPARAASVEEEMAGVVDLFYGLRFEEALAAARAAEAAHPGHPAGPFYAGVVRFQQFVAGDALSEEEFSAFEAESRRAEAAAEAWVSSQAAVGHYYLGAAHGFRARGLVARKSWMSAVGSARRGAKHLKKALALDPALLDARLGLGMYEYYIARAPLLARPLAFAMMGLWGDRDAGLAHLRAVAEHGGAARMEARSVLSAIYASDPEGRWDEAEALLGPLMERYPGNPLYRLRRAYVALRRGAFLDAARFADPGGAWLQSVPAGMRERARAAALYRAAEGALLAGDAAAARGHLAALAGLPLPDGLAPWVERRRAEAEAGKAADAAVWPQVWPLTGTPD
ncbi:MAG: hypothetical protein HY928_16565 [Elusimicrobia bacterium]|nr:hypothetical protein [Elusimicrobiota bacterium]